MPILQIHIPAFNEEEKIGSLLDSLQKQTFSDFTVTIHDNHSTDNTLEICREVSKIDSRFLINAAPINVGALLNGYRMRCGYDAKYIAFRAANDIIHPDYFTKTIEVLENDPSVAVAYSHGYHFTDDLSKATPCPDAFKIDTRGMDKFTSAVQVMQRYTAPYCLWGVYRRSAFEACRPYQFVNGGDHIVMAEIALYGAIAPIEEQLDYRYQPPINRHDVIASHVKAQLEEYNRDIKENSFYFGLKQHLPFTDMAWGHVEMFALARVEDELKNALINASREIFKSRFQLQMQDESARFTKWIIDILENSDTSLPQSNPSLFIWLLKLRKEIDKIRFFELENIDSIKSIENYINNKITTF